MYFPPTDAALSAWADNFSTLITAAPATYGLVAGDATAIAAVVTPFVAAVAAVADPGTRTAALVADKNAKRAAMAAVVRPYAQQIRHDTTVTDMAKKRWAKKR